MKARILKILLLATASLTVAQEVDEQPMRNALDKWHEFYHAEIHKCDTNNPAFGMSYDGYNLGVNTRRSQLRFFDRKVCRLFGAITDGHGASNFVWQIDQWTTNTLPIHP